MTGPPPISGSIPDYVRAAQVRGVVSPEYRMLSLEPLTGGRTGARVTAIRPGYVLKVLPRNNWRLAAMQAPDAGEGPLWLSGATRELPAPVACPTVDVVVHVAHDEWWMLMRDVSDGIRARGAFSEHDERALLAAIARLHAHYWDGRNGLDGLPLAPARGTTAAFAEPVAFAAGRAQPSTDWVPRFVEDFTPLRTLLPTFLEMLDPLDADFFILLASDRSWHRGLDDATPTLNHGDLRRANVAFTGETVTLLDWEFAARAPAACDLQWHWFLHFWAYPPGGQDQLFYSFNLEAHVPANHLLRGVDRFLDLSDLRKHLAAFYSHTGRPSIDPELTIRMLLIGYCFGIRSERRLCEEVHLNLAYRWFCRLGLEDEVPDNSSFSKNRHGRFRESGAFRHLFESVVQRCMAEGLVGGEGFAVDASVVKADANRTRGIPGAVASNDATQATHAVREYLAALDPDTSVPKNVSLTDPEARWTAAPGGPAFYAYSTNYLVDVEAGVIVDVEATTALRYAWLVR